MNRRQTNRHEHSQNLICCVIYSYCAGKVHPDSREEETMSNSDHDVKHEAEAEQPKIDERLSKLSLIARNVTLRLSSPTTTKHRKNSRRFTEKEPRNISPVEKRKKEVANLKTLSLNKIGNADFCSTSALSSNITKHAQTVGNKHNCSLSSMRSEKDSQRSPKARTCTSKSSPPSEKPGEEKVLLESSKQSKKHKIELKEDPENQTESTNCMKQVEPITHNCEELPISKTDTVSASRLTEQFKFVETVSPKKPDEIEKRNSLKRTTSSRKISGQTTSGKPRIAFGPIQRRKSMKLGERSLVRKKSFLKKGDGLAARRKQLTKQINANNTGGREMRSCSEEKRKDNGSNTFLRMPERKDNRNCTFLLTRNKKLVNKASVLSGNITTNSIPRSRRQWNENGVQVIFTYIL